MLRQYFKHAHENKKKKICVSKVKNKMGFKFHTKKKWHRVAITAETSDSKGVSHMCDMPFSWTATAWHASHCCDGFQLRSVKAQQVPEAHQALEWQHRHAERHDTCSVVVKEWQRRHAERHDTCSVVVKELVKADRWTNYTVITAK